MPTRELGAKVGSRESSEKMRRGRPCKASCRSLRWFVSEKTYETIGKHTGKKDRQCHSPSSTWRWTCSSRSVEQHVCKIRSLIEPATSESVRNTVKALVDLLSSAHSINDVSYMPSKYTSRVVRLCCFPL